MNEVVMAIMILGLIIGGFIWVCTSEMKKYKTKDLSQHRSHSSKYEDMCM